MNTARLTIDLGDAQRAAAIVAALQPEMSDGPEGTQTRIVLEGTVAVADVEAVDISSLRAALNGVIRLLDAAQRAIA